MKYLLSAKLKTVSLLFVCLAAFVACGDDDDEDTGSGTQNQTEQKDDNTPSGEEKNSDNMLPEPWYETNYWDRTDREKAGLRGKVKKWYFNNSVHTEYEYDEAGHLTFCRTVDSGSRFPEWCTWYTYDSQGRLVKEVYGRVTEKGGSQIDHYSTIETTEYEYGNGTKYVWVDPQSFDSRTFVNYLGPENRDVLNNLRKGLSRRVVSSVMNKSGHYYDYSYRFTEDGALVVSYDGYVTDENGNPVDDGENHTYTFNPIKYQGNYPYSGEINEYNIITAMAWRQNGMPLTVDGPSGLTEYSDSEKRFINPVKWTCKPGNPIDAFFGFTYSREWTYDETSGELTLLREWENQESDRPWIRPTKWEYKYDSHGNWTTYTEEYMVLIDGPDSQPNTATLSRTIEYY